MKQTAGTALVSTTLMVITACAARPQAQSAPSPPTLPVSPSLQAPPARVDLGSTARRTTLTQAERLAYCGAAYIENGLPYLPLTRVLLFASGDYKIDSPPGGCGLSEMYDFTGRWHVEDDHIVLVSQWGEEEARIPTSARHTPSRLAP